MNKIVIKLTISIINLTYMFKKLFKSNDMKEGEFTTRIRNGSKPLFSGSFIQNWYAKDFTLQRWIGEMQMLQDIGIREIILQSVIDTKNKYAVYPTKIKGYSVNDKDMILLALDAAKNIGIKVRVGLGESDDWWEKGWHDFKWLREEALINQKIIDEIFTMYGSHKGFGGWYIPYEFSEFFCTTKLQITNLNLFYKTIAKDIKRKNSKLNIMIAPYFNSNKFKIGSMELWSKALRGVLVNTGIDIVSLQDSVGVGYNTLDNVGMVFYYTRKAADDLGIKLYADIETFISTSNGNIPAPQEQILMQIYKVNPYVKGFVAFSIDHYQNRNEASQRNNYKDYLNYYNKS